LDEIGRNWPLIRNLIDDPVYKHIYHTEIENTLNIYFREFNVIEKARRLHELIRPYTVGSEGEIKATLISPTVKHNLTRLSPNL